MPTTLLAVDDSATMRKVLEMTFAGEQDLRVVTAETADAGLAKLRSDRPVLVLADVTLEGQGGYALCSRIKAESPATQVILLASKQQPYDTAKGGGARADDFIEKPFDTQQLIEKVRRLLNARPAAEPLRQTGGGFAPTASATPPRAIGASNVTGPGASAPKATSPLNQRPTAPGMGAAAQQVTGRGTLAYGSSPFAAAPATLSGSHASHAGPSANPSPSTTGSVSPPTARTGSAARPTPGIASHVPPPASIQGRPAEPGRPQFPPGAPTATTPHVQPTGSPRGPHEGAPTPTSETAAPRDASAQGMAKIATAGAAHALEERLAGLGLTEAQASAVLALSREVVERVVWEVVPVLAETLIKEEIKRLTSD